MIKPEESLLVRCNSEGKSELLTEWDYEKNAPLTPAAVTVGSHKRVWWKCSEGHEWQTEVRVRFNGAKCPFCAKRALKAGVNDLETLMPNLAKEWDNEKNGDLRPRDVLPGSNRYVWWRCSHGHSWRARIISRSRGSGCPVCTGKTVISGENDLRTLYPRLADEWNYERNGSLTPDQVTPYSNRKVWWKCELGHEWQAIIASRAAENAGCPFCTGKRVLSGFNDLATLCPDLAKEWDHELNESLTPEMVMPGSHKKVWWKCPDGHVWKAVVYSRAGNQKNGCPVCAGRTAKNPKKTVG